MADAGASRAGHGLCRRRDLAARARSGGIGPSSTRRAAAVGTTIFVSGGRRGLEAELAAGRPDPADGRRGRTASPGRRSGDLVGEVVGAVAARDGRARHDTRRPSSANIGQTRNGATASIASGDGSRSPSAGSTDSRGSGGPSATPSRQAITAATPATAANDRDEDPTQLAQRPSARPAPAEAAETAADEDEHRRRRRTDRGRPPR